MNQISSSYLNGTFFKKKGSFLPDKLSDLKLWLDATNLNFVNKTASGTTTAWLDMSTLNNNISASSLWPGWVADQIHGKPAINFLSATQDRLSRASITGVEGKLSIYAVLNADANTDMFIFGNSNIGAPGNGFRFAFGVNNTFLMASHNISGATSTAIMANAADIGTGEWMIITGIIDSDLANGGSIYKNGSFLTPASVTGTGFFDIPDNTSTFRIGNDSGGAKDWDGQLGEVIIYNQSLVPNDRSKVERYLSKKWGIPI